MYHKRARYARAHTHMYMRTYAVHTCTVHARMCMHAHTCMHGCTRTCTRVHAYARSYMHGEQVMSGHALGGVTEGKAAVCVIGAWRNFDQAGPSIRKFVLDPLDADAYAVIEAHSPDLHTPDRCEALLGPRAHGRCRVGIAPGLYDVDSSASRSIVELTKPCLERTNKFNRNQQRVWLQQDTCWKTIEASLKKYSVFARVRTDMEFFEPLPPMMMQPLSPQEAVLPAGDRWEG